MLKMPVLWPHCQMSRFSGSGCDPRSQHFKQALQVTAVQLAFKLPIQPHLENTEIEVVEIGAYLPDF